ncbi:MAG: hypothetical protein JWQ66_4430 [Mucilaginibacter sp.]|nr:hypothetical protein [Mucilaginibacter sp.]
MNILFILPEFYPGNGGGIITFYKNFIVALRPVCKRIKVLVGSGYMQDELKTAWNGVEVEYLRPELYQQQLKEFNRFDFIPSLKNNLAAAWAMFRQANAGEGFDLVECTDFGIGYLPWVIEQTIPVITRLHGSMGQITYMDLIPRDNLAGDFFRQLELLTLPFCNELQTHSNANRLFWEQSLTKKVRKMLPVFETPLGNKIVPFEKRYNYGLVTGRLQYWKGPVTLADSLLNDQSDMEVRWYGRDMLYKDSNKHMSTFLKDNFGSIWQKSFAWEKSLPADHVLKLQKEAKYGLIPSDWDMFNLSCVEFMASGTPVVCSDGAGASELVEEGVNGFLFKAGDSTDLQHKLKLMNNLTADTYLEMSFRAQQTIKKQLSSEKLIPMYLAAYEKIKLSAATTPGEYIAACYRPDRQKQDIKDVLDQQPLGKLLPYLKTRLLKKAGFK